MAGARVPRTARLEGRERLLGPAGVEEREAELVVRERVVGGELQLLAELRDGLVEPIRAGGRVRQGTMPR